MGFSYTGFSADDCAKKMMTSFGPRSPYDNAGPQSYSKGMKDKSMYPIQTKWRTFLLNRFVNYYPTGQTLESYIGNDEDTNVDPDNIVRLIPLVSLYAGQPHMLKTVQEATQQLQVNDMTLTIVLAACRILENFILREDLSVEDHVKAVIAELKSPTRLHPQPLDLAVSGHLQRALECREMDVHSATAMFGKA